MAGFDPSSFLGDLAWLKVEILLSVLGFVLLGLAAVLPRESRKPIGGVALLGLAVAATLALAYLPVVPFGGPKIDASSAVGAFADAAGRPAFLADGFSVVLKLICMAGAALTILMAQRFLDTERAQSGEFYAIVVFAVVGMCFLASGNDFATIYIGLETMALSSYVLVGFLKGDRRSNEAALKYFLLGAFASGILLFGVSLVYGTTGSFNLDGIAAAIAAGPRGPEALLGVGVTLILVGLAFKVAAVPFHMWTPDAYQGAPTPVTSLLATAAKAGAFAMLLRVLLRGFHGLADEWLPLLLLLSAASMTLGNVAAIVQDNVKRMLAFSSIAHAGYMLMGLVAIAAANGDAGTARHGLTAVVLYLVVYTFTTAGAFALVAMLRRRDIVGDRIEDFRGLSRTNPVESAVMLLFLLSLAGIPATAGFIGKWWLFGAAIRADYGWLAVLAVVNSAISLYYYVRVAVAMYITPAERADRVPLPAGLAAVLLVAATLTLWIGLYPQPFIRFAELAVFPVR